MKTNAITKFFKELHLSMRKHSPEILTGLGIAGMLTTTITAVRATPKALMLIEKKKQEKQTDKIKPIDVIRVAWKCYIPSIVIGIASTGCIIGASAVNLRRNAALATAYSLSESALKLYKDKVIETIGEKEEQKVRDAIARDRVEKTPLKTNEVIITERGNTLCLDVLSGRYFTSDMETIKKAVNEMNHRMLQEMYVSLNDFYYEIGLESTKIGDRLGWNSFRGLIELSFSSQLASDGRPCLVIDYSNPPTYDYDK